MGLENKFDAKQIVVNSGMSHRPEYYSGRGATTSDLNSDILESIYQGIEKHYGKKSAEEYAKMVSKIPKLSATDFLLTLYRLEGNKWKWEKSLLGNEKGIDVGPDYGDGTRETIAMATIADVLLGGNLKRDDTDYIRRQFLLNHKIKTKTPIIRNRDLCGY